MPSQQSVCYGKRSWQTKKLKQGEAKPDQINDEFHEAFKCVEESSGMGQQELENELGMQKLRLDPVIVTNPGVID